MLFNHHDYHYIIVKSKLLLLKQRFNAVFDKTVVKALAIEQQIELLTFSTFTTFSMCLFFAISATYDILLQVRGSRPAGSIRAAWELQIKPCHCEESSAQQWDTYTLDDTIFILLSFLLFLQF